MIDTIKFKIPITSNLYKQIKSHSLETLRYNHNEKNIDFRYITSDIHLPSYDRKITMFVHESKNYVFMEFSVPKFHYNHNIYMVFPQEIENVMLHLYSLILPYYSEFPDPSYWKIYRLDICYNWKLENQRIAEEILEVIKSFNYGRKKKSIFLNGVSWVGSSYSCKFYLKQPEFYAHDFREIKRTNPDQAHSLLNRAEGVLRFEVCLRKKQLEFLFEQVPTIDMIEYDKILKLLNQYMNQVFDKQKTKFMEQKEIIDRLLMFYDNTKAIQLYEFYTSWFTKDPQIKDYLKKTYKRHKVYRNLKALQKAGIGINVKAELKDISLTIPSSFSTNDPDA